MRRFGRSPLSASGTGVSKTEERLVITPRGAAGHQYGREPRAAARRGEELTIRTIGAARESGLKGREVID